MQAPTGWSVSKADGSRLFFKVSAKKAVSVYGLGRFPVTLYAEQWAKLLARAADIANFIDEHVGELDFRDGDGV